MCLLLLIYFHCHGGKESKSRDELPSQQKATNRQRRPPNGRDKVSYKLQHRPWWRHAATTGCDQSCCLLRVCLINEPIWSDCEPLSSMPGMRVLVPAPQLPPLFRSAYKGASLLLYSRNMICRRRRFWPVYLLRPSFDRCWWADVVYAQGPLFRSFCGLSYRWLEGGGGRLPFSTKLRWLIIFKRKIYI